MKTIMLTPDQIKEFDRLQGPDTWDFWRSIAAEHGLNLDVAAIERLSRTQFAVVNIMDRKCKTKPKGT